MKVTYITHSSFLVETRYCYLLFDYFKDALPIMDTDKPIYIFASHKHMDHFSKKIFDIADTMKKTMFILSKDIKYLVPDKHANQCIIMGAGETKEITHMNNNEASTLEDSTVKFTIETLKSTDLGVAYLITIDGELIYHAGDLNCWIWEEASKAENNDMKKRFENEIMKLSGKVIDLAFIPLDKRQNSYYDEGMKFFLKNVEVKHVFPMHMWEDYSVIKKFKNVPEHAEYADKIYEIGRSLEEFYINE